MFRQNPNPHDILEPLTPLGRRNRRWRCQTCSAEGTIDFLDTIDCTKVYEPCSRCGRSVTCTEECVLQGLVDVDGYVAGLDPGQKNPSVEERAVARQAQMGRKNPPKITPGDRGHIAFITPDGRVLEFKGSHLQTAVAYVKAKRIKTNEPYTELLNRGFIRTACEVDEDLSVFSMAPGLLPTEAQRRRLVQLVSPRTPIIVSDSDNDLAFEVDPETFQLRRNYTFFGAAPQSHSNPRRNPNTCPKCNWFEPGHDPACPRFQQLTFVPLRPRQAIPRAEDLMINESLKVPAAQRGIDHSAVNFDAIRPPVRATLKIVAIDQGALRAVHVPYLHQALGDKDFLALPVVLAGKTDTTRYVAHALVMRQDLVERDWPLCEREIRKSVECINPYWIVSFWKQIPHMIVFQANLLSSGGMKRQAPGADAVGPFYIFESKGSESSTFFVLDNERRWIWRSEDRPPADLLQRYFAASGGLRGSWQIC